MHGRQLPDACSIDPIVNGRLVIGSRGTMDSRVVLSKDSSQSKSTSTRLAAAIRLARGDSDKLGRAGGGGAGRSGRGMASE